VQESALIEQRGTQTELKVAFIVEFLYPEEDALYVGGDSNGGYINGRYNEYDEGHREDPQARNKERESR
jgi:hypothetical protein